MNRGTTRTGAQPRENIYAAAANNVFAARGHYMIEVANALDVDGFLIDEFGGTNFPLIHAALQGPRIVPTPRLIVDYARNGHLRHEEARTLLTAISPNRSWENSPYVAIAPPTRRVTGLRVATPNTQRRCRQKSETDRQQRIRSPPYRLKFAIGERCQ